MKNEKIHSPSLSLFIQKIRRKIVSMLEEKLSLNFRVHIYWTHKNNFEKG